MMINLVKTTITMNDIIAFTKKAIKDNMYVETDGECSITLINNSKHINFSIEEEYILIKTDNGIMYIDIIDKEKYQFKVLIEDCVEYCVEKAFEDFNNFFKEDNKPTDIDDLDNDED